MIINKSSCRTGMDLPVSGISSDRREGFKPRQGLLERRCGCWGSMNSLSSVPGAEAAGTAAMRNSVPPDTGPGNDIGPSSDAAPTEGTDAVRPTSDSAVAPTEVMDAR